MWVERDSLLCWGYPLGRAGFFPVTQPNAAALGDRLLGDMNAPARMGVRAGGGVAVRRG